MIAVIDVLKHGPHTLRDILKKASEAEVEALLDAGVICCLQRYPDPLDCVFGVYAEALK